MFLEKFAQCAFGVMHPGFDGAELGVGDPGDVFQRKTLKVVQQQHGTLEQRELMQQVHEVSLLFGAKEEFLRVGGETCRLGRQFRVGRGRAIPLPPELDAFWVRDASP